MGNTLQEKSSIRESKIEKVIIRQLATGLLRTFQVWLIIKSSSVNTTVQNEMCLKSIFYTAEHIKKINKRFVKDRPKLT